MPVRDFLPRTEAGFLLWLQNFVTKLPTYAAALGITPAQRSIRLWRTHERACSCVTQPVRYLSISVVLHA